MTCVTLLIKAYQILTVCLHRSSPSESIRRRQPLRACQISPLEIEYRTESQLSTCTVLTFLSINLSAYVFWTSFFGTFAPRFAARLPLVCRSFLVSQCALVPRMRRRVSLRGVGCIYSLICFVSISRTFDVPSDFWDDMVISL